MGVVRFHVGRVIAPLTLVFMGLAAAQPAFAGLTKATTVANTLNSWLLGIGTVIASIALCVAPLKMTSCIKASATSADR